MISRAIDAENTGMDIIHVKLAGQFPGLSADQHLILAVLRYRMARLILPHGRIADPVLRLRAGKKEPAAAKGSCCSDSRKRIADVFRLKSRILPVGASRSLPAKMQPGRGVCDIHLLQAFYLV